ncbi:MAG: glutathione S-transferase family protein [Alphaproteobacteria bacterium]|nr:glutathione S-transferase family protein [Alphaproteobacteria bacterium]
MTLERRTLYHFPLCPFSRKVRLFLYEKGIPFGLVHELPWQRREGVLKLNPIGDLPILVEPDGSVITQHNAICEYLNELTPVNNLLGDTPKWRAEIRRITGWFDSSFYMDVFKPLVGERVVKALRTGLMPNSMMIRAARDNLKSYLKYIEWMAAHRPYLGGKSLSMADLAVAAHLSVLDYLGEISWENYPEMKLWYSKIKSRPAFSSLLQDKIAGIMPSEMYTNLDF